MPTDYSGASTFHTTIQVVSDGDKRSAANINAATLALQDNATYLQANKLSKLEEDFAVGPITFGPGNVTFGCIPVAQRNTRRSPTIYTLLSDVDQTINPNTQQTNQYRGIAHGGVDRIVRLDTSNVENGDWVRIRFNFPLGTGRWTFRRGASGLNICTLDETILSSATGGSVEFQRQFGLWRLIDGCPQVVIGTDA